MLSAAMTDDEKVSLVHGAGAGTYVGHVPGIPRLGGPDLNLEDGPAGVADGMSGVTVLPAPITVAVFDTGCTMDPVTTGAIAAELGAPSDGLSGVSLATPAASV